MASATTLLLQLAQLRELVLGEELGIFLVIFRLDFVHFLLVGLAHLRPSHGATPYGVALHALLFHVWTLTLRALTSGRHTATRHELHHFSLLLLIDGKEFLGGFLVKSQLLGNA